MEETKKQETEPQKEPDTSQNEPEGSALTDPHGQEGISKAKYQREMAGKDAEIEKLKKQLEEASSKGTDAETKTAQLEKELNDFKAQLEDERLTAKLAAAGCISAKAAKALLPDYEGDVSKLAEAAPYLFRRTGTSGLKPEGGESAQHDARVQAARRAAGTARYYNK